MLPLPDVSQAQQGREEVMLEFPIDDTVAGAWLVDRLDKKWQLGRGVRGGMLEGPPR